MKICANCKNEFDYEKRYSDASIGVFRGKTYFRDGRKTAWKARYCSDECEDERQSLNFWKGQICNGQKILKRKHIPDAIASAVRTVEAVKQELKNYGKTNKHN
jgi:hypothetical protein